MISWGKLIAIGVIALSIFFNIILWQKYSEDQVRLQMVKSATPLKEISQESSKDLSQDRKALQERFNNNHYNIQNYGKDEPLVDVKALCEQQNGINCVYFKNGTKFYYGEHD